MGSIVLINMKVSNKVVKFIAPGSGSSSDPRAGLLGSFSDDAWNG